MGFNKSTFDEMIQSENTDKQYDNWANYRMELTDYIIHSVEDYHIKQKLLESGARRIKGTYNIEEILSDRQTKPTLAIWGAGGCNDIDIARLSRYFKLVLVDRNVRQLLEARERFGLDEESCLCVDLHFWDIDDEEYKIFEDMLSQGHSPDDIEDYLSLLVEQMVNVDYKELPHFDYSVLIGVASQLNVRFAVLAQLYGRLEGLLSKLINMNEEAVSRMLKAVVYMTEKLVIIGYELKSSANIEELKTLLYDINEEKEISLHNGVRTIEQRGYEISVSGSEILEQKILSYLHQEKCLKLLDSRAMLWPFTEKYAFLMYILTLEGNNQK